MVERRTAGNSFKTLKSASKTGKTLKRLREAAAGLPFLLGTQKRTRLKRAGCSRSGTLLHDAVAEAHAQRMYTQYKKHCASTSFDWKRLRYLTVLHSVCALDADEVLKAVQSMQDNVGFALKRAGVWGLGAAEIELVNYDLLSRINARTDDQKRKFHVLCDIAPKTLLGGVLVGRDADGVKALVHCHVLVDLGKWQRDYAEAKLRKALSSYEHRWQVELKSTFNDQALGKKLLLIARYNTKCGNEQLRFKAGFGRDLGEDVEAKMWRAGEGRKDRGDYEDRTTEDERGLSAQHVAFLDDVYGRVMRLRKDKRGYLVQGLI